MLSFIDLPFAIYIIICYSMGLCGGNGQRASGLLQYGNMLYIYYLLYIIGDIIGCNQCALLGNGHICHFYFFPIVLKSFCLLSVFRPFITFCILAMFVTLIFKYFIKLFLIFFSRSGLFLFLYFFGF